MTGVLADALVLLMEDDPVIAVDVALSLEDVGARVHGPLPSVAGGARWLERNRPDAAVLDVELLDGQAFPIAEDLRRRGVPFVYYSARASPGYLSARLEEAVLVDKSQGAAALVEALAAALADPGLAPMEPAPAGDRPPSP